MSKLEKLPIQTYFEEVENFKSLANIIRYYNNPLDEWRLKRYYTARMIYNKTPYSHSSRYTPACERLRVYE